MSRVITPNDCGLSRICISIELLMLITHFEKYCETLIAVNLADMQKDIDSFRTIFLLLQKYGDSSDREIAEECLRWLGVRNDNLCHDIREP